MAEGFGVWLARQTGGDGTVQGDHGRAETGAEGGDRRHLRIAEEFRGGDMRQQGLPQLEVGAELNRHRPFDEIAAAEDEGHEAFGAWAERDGLEIGADEAVGMRRRGRDDALDIGAAGAHDAGGAQPDHEVGPADLDAFERVRDIVEPAENHGTAAGGQQHAFEGAGDVARRFGSPCGDRKAERMAPAAEADRRPAPAFGPPMNQVVLIGRGDGAVTDRLRDIRIGEHIGLLVEDAARAEDLVGARTLFRRR